MPVGSGCQGQDEPPHCSSCLIIEAGVRAEASGMMVGVVVLLPVGVVLSAVIWRLQAYLLRWQQHNMAE